MTTTEQELDMVKAHLVETEVALQKSSEALEVKRKARSNTKQEVVTLQGQMLEVEESNARLLKRVTQQEEGSSIIKSAHLGTYLFRPRLMP
jgi:chromosome segregation ATPase